MHIRGCTPRARRSLAAQIRFALLGVILAMSPLLFASCGTEVIIYDAIRLEVRSEAPTGGPITRYDIALLAVDATGGVMQKLSSAVGDDAKQFSGPLPAGVNLVAKAFLVDLDVSTLAGGAQIKRLQLRIQGLDDKLKVLTSWSGVIDATTKSKITVMLKNADAACDADGDGVKDCAKAGCCVDGEATDCNDDPAKGGATASPFGSEDPCTQCGNKIDEDCDGADVACVDTDKDGTPDCQELACGAGAEKDKTIYPGAPETCDGKDNDCDNKTDEDLPFTGIDGKPGKKAKGDSCGAGACAGGTAVCSKDAKSLVCSSADKKGDKEICDNQLDDDCNGKINDGCALQDIDGDGVPNDKEDAACAFKYARYHSEYHPGNTANERCCVAYTQLILKKDSGWTDKDPVPANAKVTQAILSLCDTNCDKQVLPCAPKDEDGDGVAAPLDCDDTDPLTYPGADEKCGDGKVQACVGADPACDPATDKDGDGWPASVDCDDDDKTVAPDAKETCNGKDDDCDGQIDNGNPEGKDAVCGDADGECGKVRGVSVCKHWPTTQDPGALDCLKKGFDKDSRSCVGCEGDRRPDTDVCDYLDNDCDGKSDEDYQYKEEGSGKSLLVGANCDGIGACGKGKVECRITKDKAVCSTDPDGSKKQNKPELCDNQDNNCNGTTDETLTAIADSSCAKAGVCAGPSVQKIVTVCKVGKWVCDYTKVPNIEFDTSKECKPGDGFCHCPGLGSQKCFQLIERTCEGKDNDCDGKTDDDFVFDDLGKSKTIAAGCGTGACKSGTVVCNGSGKGLTCSTLSKVSKEICDKADNDCNGKVDDGMTVADSPCKVIGQCTQKNVAATCVAGGWVCDYAKVPAYQGNKETSCDDKDNDCDGKTDEDFIFADVGKTATIGQGCGAGACVSGNVVCMNDESGVTCSTLIKKSTEICDTKDNDCDGKTDEGFTYLKLATGQKCDGVGACAGGIVECTPGKTTEATCNTNANGSKSQAITELCDDKDNDCDAKTDEGCDDDGDKHCDKAMVTLGKPKICVKGGGDCNDKDANVNPSRTELCNGTDDDCNGKTDEGFFFKQVDQSTGKTKNLGISASCGLGVCGDGKIVCKGTKAVTCTTIGKLSVEICDNKDNDCDGLTDEGCDDDKDGWCDVNMQVIGKPNVCPKGAGDCDDTKKTTAPLAEEMCDNVDNDCDKSIDEFCDRDGDDFCDKTRTVIGKPTVCPKGTGDCDDSVSTGATVNPNASEICDDVDNDCSGGVDEKCDRDGDDYCDDKRTVIGKPKVCPKGGGDCDDLTKNRSPSAVEQCNNIDDNCNSKTDEDCDKDGDGFCDENLIVVGKPKVCPKGGGDCDDNKKTGKPTFPFASEFCNGIDDDCDGKTDAADAGDLIKTAPLCDNQAGVCKNVRRPASACVNGGWQNCAGSVYQVRPSYEQKNEKTCDNLDNNCDGSTDEGCDNDNDDYCDDNMVTKGTPAVCPKGGGDCKDTQKSINPGEIEDCLTSADDNCNVDTNDKDALNCVVYYKDADGDKYGVSSTGICICTGISALDFTARKGGDCNDKSTATKTHTYSGMGIVAKVGASCGRGICSGGKVACDGVGGSGVAICTTEKNKLVKEFCNAKDDDCDGTTDETPNLSGLKCNKKGVCVTTPKQCIGGVPQCRYDLVTGYEANESTCDDKDNDCDGKIDEKLTDINAAGCTVVGVCTTVNVAAKCTKGAWKCDYSGVPSYEKSESLCDAKDNDCDGKTDENMGGIANSDCSRSGVCSAKSAKANCSQGKWLCDYGSVTGYEVTESSCDGKDNDCDGKTDESFDLSGLVCKNDGVCGSMPKQCVSGVPTCRYELVTGYEATESSCDGKDNDCDGQTDETFDLTGLVCKNKGVCASMPKQCISGKPTCRYDIVTGYEATESSCDGKDNDCDGKTDEALTSLSDAKCSVAGVCSAGGVTASCSAGKWACDYTAVTNYEMTETSCDSKDNDCDGTTDQNLTDVSTSTCTQQGQCTVNNVSALCSGGSWTCNYTNVPDYMAVEAATCDKKDNDCDGTTDEGCPP